MQVVFESGTDLITPKAQSLLEAMVHHASEKLLRPKIAQNVTVILRIVKNVTGGIGNCGVRGNTSRARMFEIDLAPDSINEMLTTLAHEMVHVKQFAHGELQNLPSNGLQRWKDDYFPLDVQDEEVYYFLPWEVEAFGMEVGIVHTFRSRFNGGKRFTKKDI